MRVLNQVWRCEVCGRAGGVPLAPHEDVMSVIHKIEDSHRATSPDCQNPVGNIRVEEEVETIWEAGVSNANEGSTPQERAL